MKKNLGTKTLIDTTDYSNYTYEEYCDQMNEMGYYGEHIPEDDSEEFYDWQSNCLSDDCDCFFDNLPYNIKFAENYCLIEGNLGLWNGSHKIMSPILNDLESAIKKCISGGSIQDYSASLDLDEGVIYVNAYHHDGCNSFTIHCLNNRGYERAMQKADYDDTIDFDECKNYWFNKYTFNK